MATEWVAIEILFGIYCNGFNLNDASLSLLLH